MANRTITVGIMKVDVTGDSPAALDRLTRKATEQFTEALRPETRLTVRSFTNDGATLTPGEQGYSALEFVQLGINEKTERKLAFLLLITDVEIAAASFSYLLALPSQLTNVAILSTRRLAEAGSPEAADEAVLADRLGTLMVHCFGRLLNLDYRPDEPANYMAPIREPADLDAMVRLTDRQFATLADNLPKEANDQFSEGSRVGFVVGKILGNLPQIFRGAFRANPVRIASKLPTMIATALSVIVVMIFGAETWDFAAAAGTSQLAVFVVGTFAAASYVLYRAFSFELVSTRSNQIAESSVVTATATYLALLLTLLVLFVAFAALMYGVVVFVFPDALMSTWTSAVDGSSTDAHLRLSVFLAAVGVLSGSLGGSADSRSVVRNVLFAGDET